MLKRISILIAIIFMMLPAQAKDFVSYINYGIFNQPEGSPYIEVYFKIPYSSIRFTKEIQERNMIKYQATVGITITIESKEKIVFAKKYKLTTPLVDDTLIPTNLLDLRRAEIPNGDYILNVSLMDLNDTGHQASLAKEIKVNFNPDKSSFSSVVLLDSVYPTEEQTTFTNHDFELLPSVLNVVPFDKEELAFFCEYYPTKKELTLAKPYTIQFGYRIYNKSDSSFSPWKTKWIDCKSDMFLFDVLDISKLKAGAYFLQVELKKIDDDAHGLQANQVHFIKLPNSNIKIPFQYWQGIKEEVSFSQLKEMGKSLMVVSTTEQEKEWTDLIAANDTTEKPWIWLYGFCANLKPTHPSLVWYQLLKDAKYVEKNFKMQKTPGCHTDRGRVYLKYGQPTTVIPYEDEPNAYPYEIWQYNIAGMQSNARFIFYNPTRVPGNYVLLHSDVSGETQNPQWKKFIYRRTNKNINMDDNDAPDDFGGALDRKY